MQMAAWSETTFFVAIARAETVDPAASRWVIAPIPGVQLFQLGWPAEGDRWRLVGENESVATARSPQMQIEVYSDVHRRYLQ